MVKVQRIKEYLVAFEGNNFGAGPLGVLVRGWVLPDLDEIRLAFERGVELQYPIDQVFWLCILNEELK